MRVVILLLTILTMTMFGGTSTAYALTYKELATQIEEKHQLPIGLLVAICEVESGWRPQAIGREGEIGLCQLKPQTLALLCPNCNPEHLLNPYDNLTWAARYLVWLKRMLGTSDPDVLAVAYNGGQGSPAANYLIKIGRVYNEIKPSPVPVLGEPSTSDTRSP